MFAIQANHQGDQVAAVGLRLGKERFYGFAAMDGVGVGQEEIFGLGHVFGGVFNAVIDRPKFAGPAGAKRRRRQHFDAPFGLGRCRQVSRDPHGPIGAGVIDEEDGKRAGIILGQQSR